MAWIRALVARVRALVARIVPQGAVLLSVLALASYVAGLFRDRIFARTYGAGTELDAYNAAFVLPELALDVLVASGLTAPFVPVFTSLRRGRTPQDARPAHDAGADESSGSSPLVDPDDRPGADDSPGPDALADPDAAPRFAQTVLTLAVLLMGAASLALLQVAPATLRIVAPGFDEASQALYLDLYRIMLLTPVLFAASITLGEVLVAERRFLYYALAPILYNVGIAAGTLLLHGSMGIRAAAWGAVAGAALHLGIRVVGLRGTPVRIRFRLDTRMPALREFLRLMVPKMLSHPIEPLTFLFFTSVATTLAAGSVSSVSFARNFQSVPVSLIGASIALAAFPALSASWAGGDRAGFGHEVRRSALVIGTLGVLAAAGLAIIGPIAIRVLLGGGAFDEEDIRVTAAVLAAFSLSVPFDSLGHLTARGLYATHNTVLPVLASVAGFGVTVVTTLALVGRVGILAIPLGFAAGTALRVILQGAALAWRMQRAPTPGVPPPASPATEAPATA